MGTYNQEQVSDPVHEEALVCGDDNAPRRKAVALTTTLIRRPAMVCAGCLRRRRRGGWGEEVGEGLRRQGSWGQLVILTATANHAQQPSQHNLCAPGARQLAARAPEAKLSRGRSSVPSVSLTSVSAPTPRLPGLCLL